MDSMQMICEEGVIISDVDNESSFAFRAALLLGIQGFHVAHEPGSRGDFLQALQQLGAEPRVCRLQSSRNTRKMMPVHLSCSREHWADIFGEPECIEEIPVPKSKYVLYRWKHFCSDGSVTCIGHLFEKSLGVDWVVVMRVMVL
jgi:hypothetical protein